MPLSLPQPSSALNYNLRDFHLSLWITSMASYLLASDLTQTLLSKKQPQLTFKKTNHITSMFKIL